MKVTNLTKKYKTIVLEEVNFELIPGNIYALLGRNGAGKTTLLKILANLIKADKKEGDFDEKSVLYVPEHSYFLEYLSGYDNLGFICEIYGINKNKIDYVINEYDVKEFIDDMVVEYSQGMKHQLSIISAILINPDILLLDEPLTSLDPINIEIFKKKIRNFTNEDKIVVVSTHIIPMAHQLANKILLLKDKKIWNLKKNILIDDFINEVVDKI